MHELEFDIFEVSGCKKPASTPHENNPNDAGDKAITFSSRLVGFLKKKMKDHNINNRSNKVSLSELKNSYKSGADAFSPSCHPDKTRGEWALARVNMFLRSKQEKSPSFTSPVKLPTTGPVKMTSLQLEEKETLQASEPVYNYGDGLVPSVNDFKLAKDEIEGNELNYDFKSSDELYLDNYQPFGFKWE